MVGKILESEETVEKKEDFIEKIKRCEDFNKDIKDDTLCDAVDKLYNKVKKYESICEEKSAKLLKKRQCKKDLIIAMYDILLDYNVVTSDATGIEMASILNDISPYINEGYALKVFSKNMRLSFNTHLINQKVDIQVYEFDEKFFMGFFGLGKFPYEIFERCIKQLEKEKKGKLMYLNYDKERHSVLMFYDNDFRKIMDTKNIIKYRH